MPWMPTSSSVPSTNWSIKRRTTITGLFELIQSAKISCLGTKNTIWIHLPLFINVCKEVVVMLMHQSLQSLISRRWPERTILEIHVSMLLYSGTRPTYIRQPGSCKICRVLVISQVFNMCYTSRLVEFHCRWGSDVKVAELLGGGRTTASCTLCV
jgi:hypothetical protein